MTRRRSIAGAASGAIVVVLVVLLAASSGGSPRDTVTPEARVNPAAAKADSQAPLKGHPHVVIALAPGDIPPPGAQFAYSSGPEAQNFQPPSDAEVKRELAQLKVANLGGNGSYVNPVSQIKGLVPERIDMGVDYAGTGPILALGSGTVFNTAGAGWPGGAFIGITLDSGPFKGLPYFVAEDVKPTVRVGQHVQAGQEIAVMYHGAAGIETGWAAGKGDQPLAAALRQQNTSGDPGAWSSAAGISFDRVLVSTGAPSGIPQGTQVHGKMPSGYP
jgi:murein DD-endopeptidase MepM/ murein hydrolase activator NlpD